MIEGRAPRSGEESPALAPEKLFTSEFPLETPVDEVLDHYQGHLERRYFHGDAWPRWWPNFGPGIAAGFLGAKVHPVPGTVWFEPAEQGPIEKLELVHDAGNPWWERVSALTRRAVERWGSQVTVGHTDLGGNLDILASLRTTEQLLFDVSDAPGEVARLVGESTRLWLRYYDELHAHHPAGRAGHDALGADLVARPLLHAPERFRLHDLAADVRALRAARPGRLLREARPRLLPPGRQGADQAPGHAPLAGATPRHPVDPRRWPAARRRGGCRC